MGCDKKHIGLRVRYTYCYSISNFSERGYVTILEHLEIRHDFVMKVGFP